MSERSVAPVSGHEQWPGFWGFVAIGLATTGLLCVLKVWFEHTPPGHRLELYTYELLTKNLSAFNPENPVIVLDISALPGHNVGEVTPRDRLREIVEALVAQRPRAVGIDIDFSPGEHNWMDPENDPEFLEFCLSAKETHDVSIFLGVDRRKGARPDQWLGAEDYKGLAAAVVARAKGVHDRVPIRIQAEGVGEGLPTLGYALAGEYRKALPGPPGWLKGVVKDREGGTHHASSEGIDYTYADTLVNYSNLAAMRAMARRDISAESVAQTGDQYKGALVLLGDATQATDYALVPGVDEPVPGVFLHASVAYTLVKEPLFEFKHWFRLVLDFLIAGTIVLAVALFRRRAGRGGRPWRRLQMAFIFGAAAFVLVAGCLLVRLTGVMWTDFFLVVAALLLHPGAEERLHGFAERRRRPAASAVEGGMEHESSGVDVGGRAPAPAGGAGAAAAQAGQEAGDAPFAGK